MPFSLVPIVDVGPSLYRVGRQRRAPLGLDQGGYSLHLGPNEALLWTPNPVLGATKLADDAGESLGPVTRGTLDSLGKDGRSLPLRFGDAVANLLVTPPATAAWKALTPTTEGLLEVRLGPGTDNVIWSKPALRGGVDVVDDFTRTAANLAGSTTSDGQTTWAEDQGTAWVTDGTEAVITGATAGFCVARLNLAMATADHYSSATLSTFTRSGAALFMGLMIRANNTPTSGYGFEIGNDSGTNGRRFYNFVTDATLASDTTAPATAALYVEMNGSTYTCKVAGATVFNGTDVAFDGTVKGVGIASFCNDNGNTGEYSIYQGADLGAPAAQVAPATLGTPYFRVRLRQY